jgi:hypothetical protein
MKPTHFKHKLTAISIVLSLTVYAQRDTAGEAAAYRIGDAKWKKALKEDSVRKAPNRLYLSINAGLSIPTGTYGGTQANVAYFGNPGFAGTGFHYNAIVGVPILNQQWAIVGMVAHSSNSVNAADFLAANAWYGINLVSAVNSNTQFNFYNGMVGIAKTYKGEYVGLDIRAMVGYIAGLFPKEQDYITSQYGPGSTPVLATYQATTYGSFAYDFGLSFKVFVTTQTFLMLNTDLFFATAKLSDINVQFNQYIQLSPFGNPVLQTTLGTSNPAVSQFNLSIGIGHAFPYIKRK